MLFPFPPPNSCSVAVMCVSHSLCVVVTYHTVMCYTCLVAGLFFKYMGLPHHKGSCAEIAIC